MMSAPEPKVKRQKMKAPARARAEPRWVVPQDSLLADHPPKEKMRQKDQMTAPHIKRSRVVAAPGSKAGLRRVATPAEVTAAPAASVKRELRKPVRKAAAKAALAKAVVAAVREVEAAQLVLPSRRKLRASQKNASRENHGSDLSREFPA